MWRRPLLAIYTTLSIAIALSNYAASAGQTAEVKDAPLPTNPKKLLLLAAQVNSLSGDDLKPWHLSVSYKLLNGSGNVIDHGTIEERWAGANRAKLIITTESSTLTYVRTDQGTYMEGNLDGKMAFLRLLESSFVRPVPFDEKSLGAIDLELRARAAGTVQLPCFTIKQDRRIPSSFNDPAYCLENNSPILRIGGFPDDSRQFVRNKMGKFQGRYVPVEISAGEGERPVLIAHLDMLRQISAVDPADFKPGPNAVREIPAQTTLVVPEGEIERMIEAGHLHPMSRPMPECPAIAQAAHVHGTVEMRVKIGTDGRVHSVYIISGPAMLRQAASDAVWQWRFEPLLGHAGPGLNGSIGPEQMIAVVTVRL